MRSLAKMSDWPHGARAVTEAGIFNHVPALLGSSDPETMRCTFHILGNLPFDETPSVIQAGIELCAPIVSAVIRSPRSISNGMLRALSRISILPEGAGAIADTEFLKYVPEIVTFHNGRLLVNTLENLAFYQVQPDEVHQARMISMSYCNIANRSYNLQKTKPKWRVYTYESSGSGSELVEVEVHQWKWK
ncbi:hypothetical protein DFH06DRAFT_157115 [Mycena polygramma]|nr:hypothetical protein DFH06DRAFT_157115 [Mycena polygramma]